MSARGGVNRRRTGNNPHAEAGAGTVVAIRGGSISTNAGKPDRLDFVMKTGEGDLKNRRDYVLLAIAATGITVVLTFYLSGLTEDRYWAGWGSGFSASTTVTLSMHGIARLFARRARTEPGS